MLGCPGGAPLPAPRAPVPGRKPEISVPVSDYWNPPLRQHNEILLDAKIVIENLCLGWGAELKHVKTRGFPGKREITFTLSGEPKDGIRSTSIWDLGYLHERCTDYKFNIVKIEYPGSGGERVVNADGTLSDATLRDPLA